VIVGELHRQQVLNFLLVGQRRSGLAVVQSIIDQHPEISCHTNLFHESDNVRKAAHEQYFGPSNDEEFPEWCERAGGNPECYLTRTVFDHPMFDEKTMGISVYYSQIRQMDLWEYFHERSNLGDFCVIHVIRNPLACFISLQQAKRTGRWTCMTNKDQAESFPVPLAINPAELINFVRNHQADRERVHRISDDTIEITHRQLVQNHADVVQRLARFFETPGLEKFHAKTKRLRNNLLQDRIANFAKLKQKLPSDVLDCIESYDLS